MSASSAKQLLSEINESIASRQIRAVEIEKQASKLRNEIRKLQEVEQTVLKAMEDNVIMEMVSDVHSL